MDIQELAVSDKEISIEREEIYIYICVYVCMYMCMYNILDDI